MTVAVFLKVYFWLMVIYVAGSVVAKLAKAKKLSAENVSRGMWVEEVSNYALLLGALLGVYGYIENVPILNGLFWQVFVVAFGLFSALQYFMPKTQYLLRTAGKKTVFVVYLVGILLVVPMFFALVSYGFLSPNLWTHT